MTTAPVPGNGLSRARKPASITNPSWSCLSPEIVIPPLIGRVPIIQRLPGCDLSWRLRALDDRSRFLQFDDAVMLWAPLQRASWRPMAHWSLRPRTRPCGEVLAGLVLPVTSMTSQEYPTMSSHFCRLAPRAIFPAVLFTNQPASTSRTSKLAIWKAARARWRISSVT